MRRALAAIALLGALAVALAACGVGGGSERNGEVQMTITRDFGAKTLDTTKASGVPEGETVMRFLQKHQDVQTRYGGGFVQSIEGLPGIPDRKIDWFYYVNGIEPSVGAAEQKIVPGDRIWWDRHSWAGAMRSPAVVGSFPEPFLSGEVGKRLPAVLICANDAKAACDEVSKRLSIAGVKQVSRASLGAAPGEKQLRVIVGRYADISRDPAVAQLGKGPQASGVYARPAGGSLELLDQGGRVLRTLSSAGGLVAATRFGEQKPTWVITGTDQAGVEAAAAALNEQDLRNHFAVAIDTGHVVSLPARPSS
jgi:hypothetical protein